MENKKTENAIPDKTMTQPVRLSFCDAYKAAREQVEEGYFREEDKKLLDVIWRVMAEMYMLDPEQRITVDGETLCAGQICEIFQLLTPKIVDYVITEYRSKTYTIVSARRYLRTMLYNAVIEHDAKEINDLYGGCE